LYSHDTGDVFYRFHASEWACTLLTSSNNNLFYQDGGGTKVFEGIPGSDNWTVWKTVCSNKYDDDTSTSDPLFVSVGNDNYNISQSSPAYNKGFTEIDQNLPGLDDANFLIVQTLTAATGTDYNEVDLSWDAVPDANYTIIRSTSWDGSYSYAATATTNSYTDTGLTGGDVYYYKVCAVIDDVNQAFSNAASAMAYRLPPIIFQSGFETGDLSNWEGSTWAISGVAHGGSYSARGNSAATYLTKSIDTSNITTLVISFWYRDDDIDNNDDAMLQYKDIQSNWDDIEELGITSPEDTWHYHTETRTAPQYKWDGFKFRFNAKGNDSGENLYIDDVVLRGE
jgi:hypothetical protein